MSFRPRKKISLFVDGANTFAAVRHLGFDMDWGKLLNKFKHRGELYRAHYYTAIISREDYSRIVPMLDWLQHHEWTVVSKQGKEFEQPDGTFRRKGNIDLELGLDAYEFASFYEEMILFSGDGDFICLVERLKRMGKRVVVVSTIRTQPWMVAPELRKRADEFIDLFDICEEVKRSRD